MDRQNEHITSRIRGWNESHLKASWLVTYILVEVYDKQTAKLSSLNAQ